MLGQPVSFLCPESILKILPDPVVQAFRPQHLYIRHPGQNPPHELLAPGGTHPYLDATITLFPELPCWVPLPLGDADGQFRLEEEADLDRFLAALDPAFTFSQLSSGVCR